MFACFFAFCYYTFICVLVLFFEVILCFTYLFFANKLLMFVIVWCLQVVGPRFGQLSSTFGFIFFVLDALLDLYLPRFNLLYLAVEILLLIFESFHVCFFCPANQLATSIYTYSFSFLLVSLFNFLPPPYLYTSIPYHKPLTYP